MNLESHHRTLAAIAVTACFALTALRCGGSSSSPSPDTGSAVQVISQERALGAVRNFDMASASLSASAALFRDAPATDSLAVVQQAWRTARSAWRALDPFHFGPLEAQSLPETLDVFPIDPAAIEVTVASNATLDAAFVAALGGRQKGFLALDYLLFDESGEAAALATLSGTDGFRRRTLAALLAEELAHKATALRQAWEPTGGDFVGELTRAGAGSSTFSSRKQVIDQFSTQAEFALESVRDDTLGGPLGKRSGGGDVTQAQLIHTPRSDSVASDAGATLLAVRGIYQSGLSALIQSRSAELDLRVTAQLNDAIAKLNAIPHPFALSLTANRAVVLDAWDACTLLRDTWKTEVFAALGTTATFGNGDGD